MKQSLLDLLRQGGYILYAKHGEATVGHDQPQIDFRDCSTQRNLSDYGLDQSINYGEKLRNLGIPIHSPISASPLCRTMETAMMAFGWENIAVDPFWYDIFRLKDNLPQEEVTAILDTLKIKLGVKPNLGYNTAIIAHSFPINLGLGQIPDMGTIVIKPNVQGKGYEIIDKLTFEDFMNLQ